MKHLLLIPIIFFASLVFSQTIEKRTQDQDMILMIKPHICVVPRNANSCISTIDISWHSQNIGNYCLMIENHDDNLYCWNNSNNGFFQHKVVFDKNILYQMKTQQKVIAQSLMKLKTMKPHRKFNRRRNRFPWSLN